LSDKEQVRGILRENNPEKVAFDEEKVSNFIIKTDKIIGLRAIGIIFYGALPSYLALVGLLDIKIKEIDNFSSPISIILISIIPLVLTFILIRSQYKEWYLTANHLNKRSAFTTLMILFLATIISGISGIIHNKYVFGMPTAWNWNECKPIIESLIIGIFSLVVSSTFIITSLNKEINLPGLPSTEYTSIMKKLRKDFRKLMEADAWNNFASLNIEFINLLECVDKEMSKIMNLESDFLAKKEIKPVHSDIQNLREAIELINRKGSPETKRNIWKLFFQNEVGLDSKGKSDRSKPANKTLFDSLERLKKVRLEDSICQKTILYISQLLH